VILHVHQPAKAFGLCAPTTLPFVGVQELGGIFCLLVNVGDRTIAWTAYDSEFPVAISEAT